MPARRLKTLSDARRYIAHLINRTEKGELDAAVAGKLGYLSSILIRAIEGSDVERRIEHLERQIGV